MAAKTKATKAAIKSAPSRKDARRAVVIAPGQGRRYPMGRMNAIFKADGAETKSAYSVSEWWLEPNTHGPGTHAHEEDHVYYVISGTLSVLVENAWSAAPKGSYILIPGGTPHDFENRGRTRAGFISFNTPGGFEQDMPGIVDWFAEHPPGNAGARG
jgi:mannose-6-phosphate isomerase-like protein (cupin superfamily)